MSLDIMNTRLPKKSSYQLNDLIGISSRCDWFISGHTLLKKIEHPRYIFISLLHGIKTILYFINTILPTLQTQCVLILASEDYTFPNALGDVRVLCYPMYNYKLIKNEINQLFTHSMISHMYVENLDTHHEKCTPIPLGILQYAHGSLYQPDINYKPISLLNRPQFVLSCHREHESLDNSYINYQFRERALIRDYCNTTWKSFVQYKKDLSEEELKEQLVQSTFCICVHGGGLDPSPKAWQSLLCGSIPILKHSSLDPIYERFPVVFVDTWDEQCISKEFLNKELERLRPFYEEDDKRKKVLDMLTLDYWWNIICNTTAFCEKAIPKIK